MSPDQNQGRLERLESTLIDSDLADRVELVVRPLGGGLYRAAAVDGSVEFRRTIRDGTWEFEDLEVEGRHPLAADAPDRFVGRDVEIAHRFPDRTQNSYPHAHDSIAQFFDSPMAPDLFINKTAAHFTGNIGNHGTLAITAARGPFIAAGRGVRQDGMVDRSSRTVNVAPTIAALLGLAPHPNGVGPTGAPRHDALLRHQDGDVEHAILDGEHAEHVVVFLLDGCNANLLHDVVDAGEAPALASLIGRGTAYRFGSFASAPTATLANHTTAITGVHPGRSGILHNTWFDRSLGRQPNLLDMSQMFNSMVHLSPQVETIHDAIHRNRPDAFTSATFEFCDTGADFSTFALVRGGLPPELSSAGDDGAHPARMTAEFGEDSTEYRFMSAVDEISTRQTIDVWNRTDGNPLPTLSWCALAITDEAGHHYGPHGAGARASVIDSDRRISAVLDAVEAAGALDRTAVLVIADHGMEQSDPAQTDTWEQALRSTGVAHRDIDDGFLYLER
jgi:hypothetical protein